MPWGEGAIQAGETICETFRRMRSAYPLGEDSRYLPRLRGVNRAGSGADWHIESETTFFTSIERARDWDRTNMVVGQGITRLINNVCQDGLTLDPDTSDEELDKEIAARWDDWRADPRQCDVRGVLPFDQQVRLGLRSMIVDGDVIELLTEDGGAQWVEAHRLRTPKGTSRNVIHGVLVDEATGEPREYWITKKEIGLHARVQLVAEMNRYPRRNEGGELVVLHLFNPKRFSQSRGHSAMLPLTYPLPLHDDVQFANLVLAQTAACYTVIRNQGSGLSGGLNPTGRGEVTQETQGDGSVRTISGMSPGMEVKGAAGETVSLASPNVPSPQYVEHATLVLAIIAVNFDLPLAVFMLDPKLTNFSGWRGAMDQARYGFAALQGMLASQIYTPTYRFQLSRWIRDDFRGQAARLGERIYKHKFNRPRWPYIEPLKDAQADDLRLKTGLVSGRKWCAERHSQDWSDYVAEVMADREKLVSSAMEAASRINAEQKPEKPIDWRELLNFEFKPMQLSDEGEGAQGGSPNEPQRDEE